jgi:hypothetical protein
LEQAFNPYMPPFNEGVKGVVHGHPMDPNNPDDLDRVLLCNKPPYTTTWYTRMKVYENHYRVEDSKSSLL